MAEKNGAYLIIDTETTGLHPAKHGLIELAAAALDEKLAVIETFQADVCPPENCEIDPEALQVNGFTRERIRQGLSYPKVCERFKEFIDRNFSAEPVAVGQFYPFDYAFLDHVFSASGYGDGFSAVVKGNDFIDTKALANSMNLRAQLRGQARPFASTSLSRPGGLKDRFGITGHQAHAALGDVLATREVLIKLLELLYL
jgi:DNA polymerase III epsilon subunit-like protein